MPKLLLIIISNLGKEDPDYLAGALTEAKHIAGLAEKCREWSSSIVHHNSLKDLWGNLIKEHSRGGHVILHYIGHSTPDALFLPNAEGTRDVVLSRDLGLYLSAAQSVKLLVLNSCDSASIAQRLTSAYGLPLALGCNMPVRDDIAVEFARLFYTCLFSPGTEVRRAFDITKQESLRHPAFTGLGADIKTQYDLFEHPLLHPRYIPCPAPDPLGRSPRTHRIILD